MSLCTQDVSLEDAKFINDRIREDYALNWLIDGLPAAEIKEDIRTGDVFFDMGFNLGNDEGEFAEMPALHNHYEVVLEYHTPTPGQHRVVGVLVWPASFVIFFFTCTMWLTVHPVLVEAKKGSLHAILKAWAPLF
jgi:transmembrane 9 superfamily protein 2/4